MTRDGAEEYVKGYVEYFRKLGAVFLRVDFLGWYEMGFDQSEGTVGVGARPDKFVTGLSWMRQAAGDMQLSMVQANLFDHAAVEGRFGDLIRIDNDVSFGQWYNLSEGPQSWQPIWSQWSSPFLGFTGFSDVSGPGQVILDGDPIIISSFGNDGERQTAINLFTMAGAALAITDQYDTIGHNAPFFQNQRFSPCITPDWSASRSTTTPTASSTTRRAGIPNGGSVNSPTGAGWWVSSTATTGLERRPRSIDFAAELGLSGAGRRHETCGPTRTSAS